MMLIVGIIAFFGGLIIGFCLLTPIVFQIIFKVTEKIYDKVYDKAVADTLERLNAGHKKTK